MLQLQTISLIHIISAMLSFNNEIISICPSACKKRMSMQTMKVWSKTEFCMKLIFS